MPTSSQSGAGGSCCWMRAMRSASVKSPTTAPEVGGLRWGFRASPTSSPKPLTSFRIVRGARFADHRHLDLSRILELVLDPARDVLRKPDRFLIGDLFALDHDADFAAGLQREGLRDTLEGVGDPFELFEALDVAFEDVAPRAWPRGGDGVGRLHDH